MLARDAGAGVDIKSAEKLVLGPDCRRFSYAELDTATNGYTEANVIGEGGFGKVRAWGSSAQHRQSVNGRLRLRAPHPVVHCRMFVDALPACLKSAPVMAF